MMKTDKEWIKRTLKDGGLGLAETIIIVILFYLLHLNIYIILLLITCFSSYTMIKKKVKPIKIITTNLILILYVTILIWTNYFFRGYELIGFLVVVLMISGYILYKKRRQYINTIKMIETQIYGKPLNEFKKNTGDGKDGKKHNNDNDR